MIDFSLTISVSADPAEDLVFGARDLIGFRLFERVSGLDPTLDRPAAELAAGDRAWPGSLFDGRPWRPTPPVLRHDVAVQPPYSLRVLVNRYALPEAFQPQEQIGRSARLDLTSAAGTRPVRGLIQGVHRMGGGATRDQGVEFQILPWPWALALSEKSRVWQNLSSLGILRTLIMEYAGELGDRPTIDSAPVQTEPPVRSHVIQWRESDFELFSRLMERDGLFYTFRHEAESTRIVVSDVRGGFATDEGLPAVSLQLASQPADGAELFSDTLLHHDLSAHALPRRYRVADYNPINAATTLEYGTPLDTQTAQELYDYPGEFDSLETAPEVARRRHLSVQMHALVHRGVSRSPFLAAGHLVQLPDPDGPQTVRILQSVHELARDAAGRPVFRNWFEGIDAATSFAPTQRTPVPQIHGTHNARVISQLSGESIDVDQHGRALVVFRWDRNQTPVRVRLGQPWAGGAYGMHVLPRAGDEVLVGFIQGSADQPVILNSVHNSSTPKKFNPVQGSATSIMRTANQDLERPNRHATAIHNAEGNMLYMNDTAGSELLKLDAYKDLEIEVGHLTRASNITSRFIDDRTPPQVTTEAERSEAPKTLQRDGAAIIVTSESGGSRFSARYKTSPDGDVLTTASFAKLSDLEAELKRVLATEKLYLSSNGTDARWFAGQAKHRIQYEHKQTGGTTTQWTDSPTSPAGYEPVHSTSTEFESKKEDRGTATIRTYGDLNLIIGKGTKELKNDDRGSKATIADQDDRGDYNIFVWGGGSTHIRGAFDLVVHPEKQYLIEASYVHQDFQGGQLTSVMSQGSSIENKRGSNTEFTYAANFTCDVSFSSELHVGGDNGNSLSAEVENNLLGFQVESNGVAAASVKHLFGEAGHKLTEFSNALVDSEGASLVESAAEIATQSAVTAGVQIATAVITGATVIAIFGVSIHAAKLEDDLEKPDEAVTKDDKVSSKIMRFLRDDIPRMSTAAHVLFGITYGINLVAGIVYIAQKILRAADPTTGESVISIALNKTGVGFLSRTTTTPVSNTQGAPTQQQSTVQQTTGTPQHANTPVPVPTPVPPPAGTP